MFVVKYRKIFFILSIILIALSVFGMVKYGFKEGIDFRGGTITEARYSNGLPDKSTIENQITALDFGNFSLRPSEQNGLSSYIVRTRNLTVEEEKTLVQALSVPGNNAEIERQNTIGPIAGGELKSKAEKAVLVVILMIVLFITFAFRKVSHTSLHSGARAVPSWKYGLATIIALAHDVIIPTGVFVFLGHLKGVEIDLLFITGLLAILGYSVHDTIVVFDRVRENLRLNHDTNNKEPFDTTVGKAVKQTFGRSINTSLTIFITLLALFLVGPQATKDFALLLMVGVVIGTYSSIFVASPLLVTFYNWQKKK